MAMVAEASKHPALPRGGAPLRLVLVGPSLRYLLGGQEVQLDQLARDWSADEAVAVTLVPCQSPLPRMIQWVASIPLLRTLVRLPFYLATLWRATKESEIVHAFSGSYSSFLIATLPPLVVAQALQKKTVVHYHSRKALEHLRDSATARFALRRTDCVVVPSAYLANTFGQFGICARIVPNTVPLTVFAFRQRTPLRPLLLCTRNFYYYCGLDLAVRAFAVVKRTFPDARLCLVGSGQEEKTLRNLVQQLDLAGVEFVGPIERCRIPAIYAESDILLNASREDNAPVSILEAFASGLPVVSSNAGGIPYLVKHESTGLLCEVGDWQALANNVVRVLQDGNLAQFLAHNAYQAAEQYGWEAVRQRWLEVYDSIRS